MGNRYWIVHVIDAWSEVPVAPSARTMGGEGANILIAGPQYRYTLPEGMLVIRAATNLVMVAPRIYTSGRNDEDNVHQLQDGLQLTPLSKWGTDYKPPITVPVKLGVDGKTPVSKQVCEMTPEAFFSRLSAVLMYNPPHEADRDVIRHMEKIGITPGAPYRMDRFGTSTRKAIKEGMIAGQKEIDEDRARLGEMRNGWQVAQDVGKHGTRYAQRAAWTYYAVGGNLVGDAFYATGMEDGEGKKLNGAQKYTLSFSKGKLPSAGAFWSVTLYDPETGRHALCTRDHLRTAGDGSLTLYIQHDPPGVEKESNWLPAPDGAFLLGLRLYWPQQAADSAWNPPPVVRVKQ